MDWEQKARTTAAKAVEPVIDKHFKAEIKRIFIEAYLTGVRDHTDWTQKELEKD